MRLARTLVAALAAGLLVAGCSGGGDDASAESGAEPAMEGDVRDEGDEGAEPQVEKVEKQKAGRSAPPASTHLRGT